MEKTIPLIMDEMSEMLSVEQQKKLLQVLVKNLSENKRAASSSKAIPTM